MYYDNFTRMESHMYFKSCWECEAFIFFPDCQTRKFFCSGSISTFIYSGMAGVRDVGDVTCFLAMLSLIFSFTHLNLETYQVQL